MAYTGNSYEYNSDSFIGNDLLPPILLTVNVINRDFGFRDNSNGTSTNTTITDTGNINVPDTAVWTIS